MNYHTPHIDFDIFLLTYVVCKEKIIADIFTTQTSAKQTETKINQNYLKKGLRKQCTRTQNLKLLRGLLNLS